MNPQTKNEEANKTAPTQMTNPPTETTKMVAPKKVKIKANQVIMVGGKQIAIGEEALATEEEAADFCKPYELNYNFGGERAEGTRHVVARAELVK